MQTVMTDCASRKIRKVVAVVASSVPMVASRKPTSPQMTTGLRPKRSLSGPPSNCRTALAPI